MLKATGKQKIKRLPLLLKSKDGYKSFFSHVDFNPGVSRFASKVRSLQGRGSMAVHIDQLWGKRLALLEIQESENEYWIESSCEVENANGIQVLWLNFYMR